MPRIGPMARIADLDGKAVLVTGAGTGIEARARHVPGGMYMP